MDERFEFEIVIWDLPPQSPGKPGICRRGCCL